MHTNTFGGHRDMSLTPDDPPDSAGMKSIVIVAVGRGKYCCSPIRSMKSIFVSLGTSFFHDCCPGWLLVAAAYTV